ncbi:MAG: hypothetical protein KIS67_21915 [Verrucomicrobiae bacterium]|nr:hypothetical protein [Verrucomicrobiae bacterium]
MQRLMALMGIRAIYSSSLCEPGHEIYPYLLRGKEIMYRIKRCADITYSPDAPFTIYVSGGGDTGEPV